MKIGRTALRIASGLTATVLGVAAYAHPGHGAPPGHAHGLFETLVFIGAVAVTLWIVRRKR
jgi:hypothetical protein